MAWRYERLMAIEEHRGPPLKTDAFWARLNLRLKSSLLLCALDVGQIKRLKSRLGEVGIEFAHFFRLRDETFIRRRSKIRLDLNHGIERLSAEQSFDEGKTVIY